MAFRDVSLRTALRQQTYATRAANRSSAFQAGGGILNYSSGGVNANVYANRGQQSNLPPITSLATGSPIQWNDILGQALGGITQLIMGGHQFLDIKDRINGLPYQRPEAGTVTFNNGGARAGMVDQFGSQRTVGRDDSLANFFVSRNGGARGTQVASLQPMGTPQEIAYAFNDITWGSNSYAELDKQVKEFNREYGSEAVFLDDVNGKAKLIFADNRAKSAFGSSGRMAQLLETRRAAGTVEVADRYVIPEDARPEVTQEIKDFGSKLTAAKAGRLKQISDQISRHGTPYGNSRDISPALRLLLDDNTLTNTEKAQFIRILQKAGFTDVLDKVRDPNKRADIKKEIDKLDKTPTAGATTGGTTNSPVIAVVENKNQEKIEALKNLKAAFVAQREKFTDDAAYTKIRDKMTAAINNGGLTEDEESDIKFELNKYLKDQESSGADQTKIKEAIIKLGTPVAVEVAPTPKAANGTPPPAAALPGIAATPATSTPPAGNIPTSAGTSASAPGAEEAKKAKEAAEKATEEAKQLKADADKAIAEAKLQKADADKAIAEAKLQKADAEKAIAEANKAKEALENARKLEAGSQAQITIKAKLEEFDKQSTARAGDSDNLDKITDEIIRNITFLTLPQKIELTKLMEEKINAGFTGEDGRRLKGSGADKILNALK